MERVFFRPWTSTCSSSTKHSDPLAVILQKIVADGKDHVEMYVLHKRCLSRKGIEASLACDPGEFGDSPFGDELKALMQVLKIKAEE